MGGADIGPSGVGCRKPVLATRNPQLATRNSQPQDSQMDTMEAFLARGGYPIARP